MTPLEIMARGFVMNAATIEKDVRLTDITDDERAALLKATLQALDAAGWAVVPKEATEAMRNAAIDVDSFKLGDISPLGFRESPQMLFGRCYDAMIEAGAYKV